jgi:hypothetical protein
MQIIEVVRRLGDEELVLHLRRCVREEREVTARLLVHLAEVDARGLFRDEGFDSLFSMLTAGLHLSEAAAYTRIRVARLGRRFPVVFGMLARGEVHLSALKLLAPVLCEENLELLQASRFKSKREVERLVAERFPQPDVASLIRPLGADRFEVRFTISGRVRDKLREAQELVPGAELDVVFERALDLLIAARKKALFAQTDKPRARSAKPAKVDSRHVPHELRREVFARDGGQCCFRAANGLRCSARANLQFHHIEAFARGGAMTLANLCLVCRAHNLLLAEDEFGREWSLAVRQWRGRGRGHGDAQGGEIGFGDQVEGAAFGFFEYLAEVFAEDAQGQ